jgi:hypothetical protein
LNEDFLPTREQSLHIGKKSAVSRAQHKRWRRAKIPQSTDPLYQALKGAE